MTNTNTKYRMRNRNTGKVIAKMFASREAARTFKRTRNFAYDIISPSGAVIR